MADDPGRDPLHVVFPVTDRPDSPALDVVADLLQRQCWVMGPWAQERDRLRAGDRICIYVGRKGVVADAVAASPPTRGVVPSRRDLSRYPWSIALREVCTYFDQPVVVDESLRSTLDAFVGRDLSRPWGWFVKRPRIVSRHDFDALTMRSPGIRR